MTAGAADRAAPPAVRRAELDSAAWRLHRRAWHGAVFCHIPAHAEVDPAALAAPGTHDRWGDPGQPTAYLACDVGVALAEYGRHHDPTSTRAARRLLRLELVVDGLVDLRDAATLAALGRSADLTAFLDRGACRAVARRVRAIPGVTGLIVPSMAFLDQPARCNVVLFGERLAGGVAAAIVGIEAVGGLGTGV